MDETWTDRDFPMLEAIVKHFESSDTQLDESGIKGLKAIPETKVSAAFRALKGEDPPLFLYGSSMSRLGQESRPNRNIIVGVTGHARRAVGAWPSELRRPRSGGLTSL